VLGPTSSQACSGAATRRNSITGIFAAAVLSHPPRTSTATRSRPLQRNLRVIRRVPFGRALEARCPCDLDLLRGKPVDDADQAGARCVVSDRAPVVLQLLGAIA
jgi:hypothetical protein